MDNIIVLTGASGSLKLDDVINVSEKGFKVALSEKTIVNIIKGRKKLESQINGDDTKHIPIYGTNRGCGDLLHNEITEEHINQFQIRYIKTHNCGTGNPLPIEIVRAIMLIRLNSFAKGLSGMKIETCQLMVEMLNNGGNDVN